MKLKAEEVLASKKLEIKRQNEEYKNNMKIMNQKINNRPLMMESVVKKEDVKVMNQLKE